MDFLRHSIFLRYHHLLTPRSLTIHPRRLESEDFLSVTIMELIESLQEFVEQNLSLLSPVEEAWQPTDFLPDLTAEDWVEQLNQFRESARQLSDELLVVLVGNMVTEEALPSYAV